MTSYKLDRDLRPTREPAPLNVRANNGALLTSEAPGLDARVSVFTESGDGVLVADRNPNRRQLYIFNDTGRDMYISLGEHCGQQARAAFRIPDTYGYEFPFAYGGRVWAYTGTSGDKVTVTEVV